MILALDAEQARGWGEGVETTAAGGPPFGVRGSPCRLQFVAHGEIEHAIVAKRPTEQLRIVSPGFRYASA
jgi:hypothetical protein